MIKIIFLIIILLVSGQSLKADEAPGETQDFANQLDNTKNPFDDGLPKPVVVAPKPVYQPPEQKPVPPPPPPAPVSQQPITLPALNLQGVVVGENIHQAIINDTIVPLKKYISGAQVYSVTKAGVEVIYKGKKFFLKID